MSNRNFYGCDRRIVLTMWLMLVIAGFTASLCSAFGNVGFTDDGNQEELEWVKKNAHHPKWEQMLNTANLKIQKNYGLYAVQSAEAAKGKLAIISFSFQEGTDLEIIKPSDWRKPDPRTVKRHLSETYTLKDGGTLYNLIFWAITDTNTVPTCKTEFFIPLFGRHRDMEIKNYQCFNVTEGLDELSKLTHANIIGRDVLIKLQDF